MRALITASLVFLLLATSASAKVAEWKEWKNDTYGIKMLVPQKMVLVGKKFDSGWGGLLGKIADVEMFVIGKLDTSPTLKEMQAFGIKVSGVPAKHWRVIQQGRGKNGWAWHKTYRADGRARALFAILAQSKKASVIIFLRTSRPTLRRNVADYTTWYRSITAY